MSKCYVLSRAGTVRVVVHWMCGDCAIVCYDFAVRNSIFEFRLRDNFFLCRFSYYLIRRSSIG